MTRIAWTDFACLIVVAFAASTFLAHLLSWSAQ